MRPIREDLDRAGAPVSAQASELSFWDHLGATRADEYASEDILDLCPQPVAKPDPDPEPAAAKADVVAPAPAPIMASAWADLDTWPGQGGQGRQAEPMLAVAPQPTRRAASAAQTRRARLSYRLQRVWLTPFYRGFITRGLPVLLLVAVAALLLSNTQNRAQIMLWAEAAYSAVVDRPEFVVSTLQISPVAPELEAALRARLGEELPRSSFRLDLPSLRAEIEAYDSVAEAAIRLGANGTMVVTLKERVPVALWHSGMERQLLDIDGHRVAIVAPPAQLPDMPLIAGAGAHQHVREALALLDAAQPLGDRLRGLVRVGERRWDVVLDREQRIRLPELGAMQALERVLALDHAQDLLARDVLAVDLRNPTRPVLQVSPGALETLRAIRVNPSEAPQ